MKTEITPEEYINIYEVCNWDTKPFSIVLKRLGYSDELIISGNLDLRKTPIKFLINVKEVRGALDLEDTSIQSLENLEKVRDYLDLRGTSIQSLGNLKGLGGSLNLTETPIEDLGNLKYVGGSLFLRGTPLSKEYSAKEIKKMVKVKNTVWLE